MLRKSALVMVPLVPGMLFGQLVRESNTTVNLPPVLPTATGYTTANAFPGISFNAPMATATVAGDANRLFVALRAGTVRLVKDLATTPSLVATPYLSLASLLPAGQSLRSEFENGFLSFVFHPDFGNNGRLFAYFSMQDSGGQLFQRLHEVTVADPAAEVAVIASHRPLLTLLDRQGNHNGGDLHFDSAGYLYLSLGDEGASGDSFNNSRFIHQAGSRIGFWGQLLRLDVDDRPGSIAPNAHSQNSATFPSAVHAGAYRIPADNPFIGTPNDRIIFGTSVTGGRVYRGNRLTELYGNYVFSDYNLGHIAALWENPDGSWSGKRLATRSGIVHFGVDPRDGDLLMCDLSAGQLRRLVRSGTSGTAPPATLSGVGVFSDLADLTPHAGVVSYDLNVPFWSDHATKRRWFVMGGEDDQIGYQRDGNWTFPTGMVWVKHFDLETTPGDPATSRKWETRVIRKTADGIYGLSYRWRDDQSDADLVGEEGLTVSVPSGVPARSWRFPSRSECLACHTPAGGLALGFNTRQLNREHEYGVELFNQLQAFGDAGFLDVAVSGIRALPALSPMDDEGSSLEDRVRSYLAANCVQCHQPGGPSTGTWDARAEISTEEAGIIHGLLANPLGDPLNRLIVPGEPSRSMILRRLLADHPLRMPPVGSFVVDQGAVDLLTRWITEDLPGRMSFREWQEFHFGSADDPLAAANTDDDGDGRSNRLEFLTRTHPRLASDAWSWDGVSGGEDGFTLRFLQPANRAAVVETSASLGGDEWQVWDVYGNSPDFPAAARQRVMTGPIDGDRRFFRVRFLER